jgi:hypothetical protein
VKAEKDFVHSLIIVISKLNDDPNYISYRNGWKIRPVAKYLLETTGMVQLSQNLPDFRNIFMTKG